MPGRNALPLENVVDHEAELRSAYSSRTLAERITILQHDLMEAGLYHTGHLMTPAVQNIGYEIAEKIEKHQKAIAKAQNTGGTDGTADIEKR